jgi:hypothetical protein
VEEEEEEEEEEESSSEEETMSSIEAGVKIGQSSRMTCSVNLSRYEGGEPSPEGEPEVEEGWKVRR